MNFLNNILSKTGAAALAVALGLTPYASDAATITIIDLNNNDPDYVLSDTGHLTKAAATNISIGGMLVDVDVNPQENGTESILNTVSVSTSGAGNIRIITSEDGYGAGAHFPNLSKLLFSLTSTNATDGVSAAMAYVNNSNTLEAMEDMIGGTLSLPVVPSATFDAASTSDLAALNDPFSMTTVFEVSHNSANDFTQFNATALAAVPLPAAGWMLMAGIGGLAAMRRRKKT